MKRILTILIIIAMLLTMTVTAYADDATPNTNESQVAVDSTADEPSSVNSTEEPSSETVSLGITSESNSSGEAELDFALTMIVFVVATAAIVGIIVLTTRKK